MSTALALHRTDTPATVDWSREIEGAKVLYASGLLPSSIKTAQQALYVILTGRDLGLSPVQSLRSINVIQGKIEVAADMQLALFHRHGGRSHWAELTNDRAVLVLAAPWLTESHTETFTMEDAKRAGLSGDNWRKYPKAMLRSRAITAGMKSAGFDVLAGAYAEGEIGGPEPVVTAEAEAIAVTGTSATVPITLTGDVAGVDDGSMAGAVDAIAESYDAALAEIEATLPGLATNQQAFVREKLRDGVDPAELLPALRRQAMKRKATETRDLPDGATA